MYNIRILIHIYIVLLLAAVHIKYKHTKLIRYMSACTYICVCLTSYFHGEMLHTCNYRLIVTRNHSPNMQYTVGIHMVRRYTFIVSVCSCLTSTYVQTTLPVNATNAGHR